MSQPSVQLDPLNSPYPIPWNWIMSSLTAQPASAQPDREPPKLHYYRSPSLLSPDGCYAAYSRIQLQVQPEFYQSRVSSVLFLENLETGNLQAITPTSPLADNPFGGGSAKQLGPISIVIPIAWSAAGDCLLAREFESLFCSDVASDYAVIVNVAQQRVSTIAPTRVQYTTAILLGWSEQQPQQALFRVGELGSAVWHLWAVDASGQTTPAPHDRPVAFGEMVSNVWVGPQG